MLLKRGVQTREALEGALKLNLHDVERLSRARPGGYLDTRVIPFQPRPRTG